MGLTGAELPDLSVIVDAYRGTLAQVIDSGPFFSIQCLGEICFQPHDVCGEHPFMSVDFANSLSYQSVARSLSDGIRFGGAYWQDNP